jgi:hypothetical protein
LIQRTASPIIAVLALVACAATAQAAPTRADYVAQVDPICQASKASQKHEARKYKRQFRRLREQGLDPDRPTKRAIRMTVRFYDRLARIQRGTTNQIAIVPPAPGDEPLVAEWLRLRSMRIELTNHAIHAYARNRKSHQFKRLLEKANLAEINAESAVADFHFRYCTPLLAP